MERTVPSTASEEIELYLRTVYSLLRSTTEVQIRALEEVHAGMNSLLHPNARGESPDMSAFIYSMLRLPDAMPEVRSVILGQSLDVFSRHGFPNLQTWESMSSRARRRRCYFDRNGVLACLIASRSDIDDIIPALVSYQIEWNKMHHLLQRRRTEVDLEGPIEDPAWFARLSDVLLISPDDLMRLNAVWGSEFRPKLSRIADGPSNLAIRLLSGSYSEYRRATNEWWSNIKRVYPDVMHRPVYFVSSNTHSATNLLSGFALDIQEELVETLLQSGDKELIREWEGLQITSISGGRENFLYYLLKKLQQSPQGQNLIEEQNTFEAVNGITRIPSDHYFDVEAQVFELAKLNFQHFDSRLGMQDAAWLQKSDSLIINIDYPLGLAAYNILTKIAEQTCQVLGVYVMGKAAALNCTVGDVMIPNVVHDEHSLNTYLFQNAFTAGDVLPHLIYGTVLDNQKTVSVSGTFLQNAHYMDVFYREGYTGIEMEAGPYLSAAYEMYRPKRHPVNEIVNLYGVPFEIGVLHYASDTPLSKGRNLGAGTLSYFGIDSTYATTIAILRRIFAQEQKRLSN